MENFNIFHWKFNFLLTKYLLIISKAFDNTNPRKGGIYHNFLLIVILFWRQDTLKVTTEEKI